MKSRPMTSIFEFSSLIRLYLKSNGVKTCIACSFHQIWRLGLGFGLILVWGRGWGGRFWAFDPNYPLFKAQISCGGTLHSPSEYGFDLAWPYYFGSGPFPWAHLIFLVGLPYIYYRFFGLITSSFSLCCMHLSFSLKTIHNN